MTALFIGLCAMSSLAQETQPPVQRIAEQEHWVTSTQLFSVLSLDYEVQAAQNWLMVLDGSNQFFIQASEQFPEIRIMQAWGNVGITYEELNRLNNQLSGGRLFITSEDKIQLVLEHSYHGMKMNTIGLVKCVERFTRLRDEVVKMIYEL